MSKALVTLFEREQMCVPVIKELITQEVAASTHLSTLFRTNSFATKLFKTFSKIVGLPYVHETLGYEMNYNIHKVCFRAGMIGGCAQCHALSCSQRSFSPPAPPLSPPVCRHQSRHP